MTIPNIWKSKTCSKPPTSMFFEFVSWISELASLFVRGKLGLNPCSLPAKLLGDEVGICHDHRQRITGRHEELRPTNHVAICIPVRCSTEAWDRFARLDLVTLLQISNRFKRHLFKVILL